MRCSSATVNALWNQYSFKLACIMLIISLLFTVLEVVALTKLVNLNYVCVRTFEFPLVSPSSLASAKNFALLTENPSFLAVNNAIATPQDQLGLKSNANHIGRIEAFLAYL